MVLENTEQEKLKMGKKYKRFPLWLAMCMTSALPGLIQEACALKQFVGTSLWPVRNRATQQKVSGRPGSQASSPPVASLALLAEPHLLSHQPCH